MKTEIKLNDFPDPPPVKLPRLIYYGVLNDICIIALQTRFSPNTENDCFDGVVLYSTEPNYAPGLQLQNWNIQGWKEFTHTLILNND